MPAVGQTCLSHQDAGQGGCDWDLASTSLSSGGKGDGPSIHRSLGQFLIRYVTLPKGLGEKTNLKNTIQ